MSDNEDWRRELAERLHPNTDWTVRPIQQRAAPPVAQMAPIEETHIATPSRAPTEGDAGGPVDRARHTEHPTWTPIVTNAPQMFDARIWPYVVAALAMLAAAAGWVFMHRVGESSVVPAMAPIAAAPASVAAASAGLAPVPANESVRCDGELAAPVLSALVRRGTAFDERQVHVVAPATLSAVRQSAADGSTALCRGVLELQLADLRSGSPVLQIISGPVDYAVDGAAGASMPTFRLLRARSILHRLAMMPPAAPVAVAAAEPGTVVPRPVVVERAKPIQVTPAAMPVAVPGYPVQAPAAGPLPTRRAGAETMVLPTTTETLPLRRAEVEAAASPAAGVDASTEVIRPIDEQAADSAAAQAIYGAIAHSGDPQAIGAADEGRDLYLRQSRRCVTPVCAAVAYKRWLTQLRDIDERSRGYVNY